MTEKVTRTGGRPAIEGVIRGRYSLSVGNPGTPVARGWTWTALTSLARLESGHTPSRKHPEYWGGDIPWIGIRDATTNHGRTLDDTIQHTNALGILNSSARLLPTHTVCLSRTASVGYVVVTGRPMATSQDFVNWVCSEELDYQFLMYVLLAEHETFLSFASGTTHQTIYYPEVKAFHICHPAVGGQQRIAHVLSAIDDLIESNRRRVEVLEGMARAIYRQWFVRFRYPGYEDVPLFGSSLGPIPDGWKVGEVGDLASIEKGLSYKGDHLSESGTPMANLKCMRPGGGFRRSGTKSYDGVYKPTHSVLPGDMVIANTDLTQVGAVIGSPALIPGAGFEGGGIASHHLFIVRPVRDTTRHWLYESFRDDRFRNYARSVASGTTVLGFRPVDLAAYRILVPPLQLAEAFSRIAGSFADLREDLDDVTAVLEAQRKLLLPRLVTGKIDVSDLDLDALTEAATA